MNRTYWNTYEIIVEVQTSKYNTIKRNLPIYIEAKNSFDAKLMAQLQYGHNAIVRQPTICKNWWNK